MINKTINTDRCSCWSFNSIFVNFNLCSMSNWHHMKHSRCHWHRLHRVELRQSDLLRWSKYRYRQLRFSDQFHPHVCCIYALGHQYSCLFLFQHREQRQCRKQQHRLGILDICCESVLHLDHSRHRIRSIHPIRPMLKMLDRPWVVVEDIPQAGMVSFPFPFRPCHDYIDHVF